MNSKRRNADTAHRLAQEFAKSAYNEALVDRLKSGFDPEVAESETRNEFADPERVLQLEREFRERFSEAAEVTDQAAARWGEGGRVLRPVAEKYGLDLNDRHVGAWLAADPLGYRVLDAVADENWNEAECEMRHVVARVTPEQFLDRASRDELDDAMRNSGYDPKAAERARYEAMTPEELDREMEREFGTFGAKKVAPGVLFTTAQK